MADTRRDLSVLQTILATNYNRNITAQGLRDFLVSAELKNLVTKTANYVVDADDQVVLLDGSSATVEATLPTAVGILGKMYVLKCIDKTNACTVATNGSETIEGAAGYTFGSVNDSIRVVSNNANWYILASDLTAIFNKQIFTSGSGTYTPTSGTKAILVECVGAGGGGGGAAYSAPNTACGAGGGGAGYVKKLITSPSASYAYTVGAGGAGGVAGNNNGAAGTNTTFGSAFIIAIAGAGGAGAAATAGVLINYSPGAGGGASGGDVNIPGSAGLFAWQMQTGYPFGSQGGVSMLGVVDGISWNGAGFAGNNYGCGGGGAGSTSTVGNVAGGAGSGGIIIIWEYK